MSPAEPIPLEDGWEAAPCAPDSHPDPGSIDDLGWIAARVPGTAAAALRDAGRWRPGDPLDLDSQDWWFRTRFAAAPAAPGEEVVLRLGGIATVAEVHLNGELLAEGESMFAARELDVGPLLRAGGNELAIRCRALGPLLGTRRKPRARWRTRLVDGRLRFFRTMLLGRAPGFAPGPAAVGPWRPVSLRRRRGVAVEAIELRPRLDGEDGVLAVRARLRPLGTALPDAAAVELSGASGTHRAELRLESGGAGAVASGELRVPGVDRWWPHTHGEPVLHDVSLLLGPAAAVGAAGLEGDERRSATIEAGRVGFRELAGTAEPGLDPAEDGLALHVNGLPVFCRGAVWTPADPVGLAPSEAELRHQLELAREAGMNMLRVVGTGAYESHRFHDLCDELGILVWQDFMFANLDYPVADEAFMHAAGEEVESVLTELAGRPSLAVLCGNSEVEQQASMMGRDPQLGRGPLFGELIPRLAERAGVDAVYLPSAPCGGDFPFRPDRGVANYFGVGGYRRPLSDARLAGVRFAAECLALANVPDEEALAALLPEAPADLAVHHPRWKAGVPRDAGTGWDFDDVRDHYLRLLFGVDPGDLRRYDHERYLELSRATSGEVMAAVFGEWRRAVSSCAGGLVLWLRDLAPGAGWGVLDHAGAPKAVYHHLRRALAPRAVWMTDEGLSGVAVHVANDSPAPLCGTLRVGLYRDFEQPVGDAEEVIEVPPRGALSRDVEALLGTFVDASWAYRFGPPAQNLIVAAFEPSGVEGESVAPGFHFPAGLPTELVGADRIGLRVTADPDPEGLLLELEAAHLLYGARAEAPGLRAEDAWFSLEPGRRRRLRLRHETAGGELPRSVSISAVNLRGRISVPVGG